MKKFLKPGRVVILLSGKHAGKKALIVKVFYEGSKERKFGHCLVAGISRYPRKVTRAMGEAKIARRIRVKPFVQYANFNHFIPTRYLLNAELDTKNLIKSFDAQSSVKREGEDAKAKDPLANADFKGELKREVKKLFEERYARINLNDASSENLLVKFFFKPLRF